jgi:hypothetical protein
MELELDEALFSIFPLSTSDALGAVSKLISVRDSSSCSLIGAGAGTGIGIDIFFVMVVVVLLSCTMGAIRGLLPTTRPDPRRAEGGRAGGKRAVLCALVGSLRTLNLVLTTATVSSFVSITDSDSMKVK